MKVVLYLNKSIEENSSIYYDNAKKLKKKIEGTKKAIDMAKAKLVSEEARPKKPQAIRKIARKLEWYEKFRWFISSEGFLCIGGKDATTNEIVIKKHTDPEDIVFHTDMAGSPFFVIKTDKKIPGEATMNEVAEATASYSRAWKMGYGALEVFHVKPEQVSKEANPGEYMAKGSFMIRGKTNYMRPLLKLAIGIKDGVIIGGPLEAIKKNAEKFIVLQQGEDKPSDIAKKIAHKLGSETDDVMRFMPAGGSSIPK